MIKLYVSLPAETLKNDLINDRRRKCIINIIYQSFLNIMLWYYAYYQAISALIRRLEFLKWW